jgi:outer membrane protein OmpA-like peptidoglycan-associated protein
MEARFGHDFSQVRVHADPHAAASATAVSAEAYTVGRHVVFGDGAYRPETEAGRRLVAHELTHVVQQGGGDHVGRLPVAPAGGALEAEAESAGPGRPGVAAPSVQRLLRVDPNPPGTVRPDPAAALTFSQRNAMVDSYVGSLCDDFAVDHASGDVVPASGRAANRNALAAGSKPTGCCCLAVLDDSPKTWMIEISAVKSPRTSSSRVTLPPTDLPIDWGSWTAGGTVAFQGLASVAGHELCGHAALIEVGAHPVGGSRLTTDVHDPTVRIENAISAEQGVPAAELRGLAGSGPHRGESAERITVRKFDFNGSDPTSSLPPPELRKLEFVADFVQQNDTFVDVIGHSDRVGSATAKQLVSRLRAERTQRFLGSRGVAGAVTLGGRTFPRFTRVEGVSDNEPPPAGVTAPDEEWRRVDVFVASFPAGAQRPPAGTSRAVNPHTSAPGQTAATTSLDPCVALLARTGDPTAGMGDFPLRLLPPGREAA